MKKSLLSKEFWAYALFWSWNIIFLTFMILGFAPTILPEMITAVRTGTIPIDFLIYGGILTLIPVLAAILGATLLRREPGRLFVLGYGIEGPLMLLLAVRFFIIRDQTAAVVFIQVVTLLGLATLLWQILDKEIEQRGRLAALVRLFGLTLLLVVGLYASLWLAFYALPLAYAAASAVVEALGNLPSLIADIGRSLSDIWREGIRWIPFSILGFLLLAYTLTLFVLMPIAVPILYGRAWWGGIKHLRRSGGRNSTILVPAAVLAALLTLFWLSNKQPQAHAFALLEEPPANVSEMVELRDQEATIRAGLLNAYLAPQRYISAEGEVFHIRELYKDIFDLPENSAAQVQQAYEKVAQPLLYRPVNPPPESQTRWWSDNRALRQEPQQAAELYERFFDEPIIEGEEEAVVRAARATWDFEQARANWQAVADREVFLAEQVVTVNEHGDWAEVELYEVYQNQTAQNQEVVYYFSLPESAVINGVWLGESADRENRYTYQVAPRGAAQALYRNEVRRQVDPALVEQIGPRQYRLRIFPVPPLSQTWDQNQNRSFIEEAPPLHMWLTYRVMGSENGWPLPQLADERNVYWDAESSRLINGASLPGDEAAWLPPTVEGKPQTAAGHQVRFGNDASVTAVPEAAIELPPLAEVFGTSPEGLRLAAILDRSRSMGAASDQAEDALSTLATSGAAVDVFLTASEFHGEQPAIMPLEALQVERLEFYGGQNAAELLAQYETLRGEQEYDAILVLTDGSGYKLGDGVEAMPIPDAPLWMVHVDGRYPLGYDDATLEAIQASGGGVAGSVDEALQRLSVRQLGGSADLVDGYLWQVTTGDQAQSPVEAVVHDAGDPFAALAARRLILAAMQENKGDLSQLDILDGLHETAVEQSIITPYSSMIVLVDARQKQLLDKLSNQGDRFERELEQIGETTPVTVTGVPEPHEWLLIGLALMILAWFVKENRDAWGLDTERV